jgi:uracil phosphoribosyltransferase
MGDSHATVASMVGELVHQYGERVHFLDNPYLQTAIARLSTDELSLGQTLPILRSVYQALFVACSTELPTCRGERATRMSEAHPKEGVVRGEWIDPSASFVICDVIRAGIVPSQVLFELLLGVVPESQVRLDHLNMSRISGESGAVEGVDLSGSKIGGSVEGATLFIPDPMGATGSTALRAMEHYSAHHGRPARVILLPMIATPEFLRAVLEGIEDVSIFAGRLDRGLSEPDVLAQTPGAEWERERGLNSHDYIVPGAGGMGEVLNNSWC